MFNFGKKKQDNEKAVVIPFKITAPLLFHKECNGRAEHGKLCATHATLNVGKNDGVRFAFDGIEPPMLTAEVMAYITDCAERKGYVVHHLHSYVNVCNQIPAPVLRTRDETAEPVLVNVRTHGVSGTARGLRKASGMRAQAQS